MPQLSDQGWFTTKGVTAAPICLLSSPFTLHGSQTPSKGSSNGGRISQKKYASGANLPKLLHSRDQHAPGQCLECHAFSMVPNLHTAQRLSRHIPISQCS